MGTLGLGEKVPKGEIGLSQVWLSSQKEMFVKFYFSRVGQNWPARCKQIWAMSYDFSQKLQTNLDHLIWFQPNVACNKFSGECLVFYNTPQRWFLPANNFTSLDSPLDNLHQRWPGRASVFHRWLWSFLWKQKKGLASMLPCIKVYRASSILWCFAGFRRQKENLQ